MFLISFQTLLFIIWLSFVFVFAKHFKMWPLRTSVWLLFTLTIAKSLRQTHQTGLRWLKSTTQV